jgi:hypothetical protein
VPGVGPWSVVMPFASAAPQQTTDGGHQLVGLVLLLGAVLRAHSSTTQHARMQNPIDVYSVPSLFGWDDDRPMSRTSSLGSAGQAANSTSSGIARAA